MWHSFARTRACGSDIVGQALPWWSATNEDNSFPHIRSSGSTSSASRNFVLNTVSSRPGRGGNAIHEAQRVSSHVFIGRLQVETDSIADQYPLLAQFSLSVVLGADLEEEVHEFLQRLRLGWHDEAYYVHEQTGLGVSIEHDGEDFLLRTWSAWMGKAGQGR